VNAVYACLLYNCEISECALICIISFLSFFPSQFSAPFCPEKLNNFLFWQRSSCLVGVKMSLSAVCSCRIPQARPPDRSPCDGPRGSGGRAGTNGGARQGVMGLAAPSVPPKRFGPRQQRGTRQPAKSPQSRGAGSRCQVPRPYSPRASSETLQHRLGTQPSRSPVTSAVVLLPGPAASCATPAPSPRWGGGLSSPSAVSRELPGCAARPCAPPCFGGR